MRHKEVLSLIIVLVTLLFVPPPSLATSYGSVTDLSGDAATGAFDFISGSAVVEEGNLILTVNFEPGTFDWSEAAITAGLDVDQNPNTGYQWINMGMDYMVKWGGSSIFGAYRLSKYDGLQETEVTSDLATTHSTDSTSVTIPLSLLGNDDGVLNFHFQSTRVVDVDITSRILDYMPNPGTYGITAPNPIYFAQVANGGGYTTTFTIFNPTSNAATGTLTLRDGEGNPLIFSMMNGSTDSQFDLSIPANGSVRLESSGTGNIETGWAVIEPSELLQGVATFDYRPISVLLDSVGVVGTIGGNRFLMPIDISSSADEGLAIVNPGTSDVAVRLTLLDENGNTYASLDDPQLNPLSAKKSLSLYVTSLFPSLQSSSFKGLLDIEVVESGYIAVMGLSYKEGQITIIPVLAPQ